MSSLNLQYLKTNINENYEYYSFGVLVLILYFSPTFFLSILSVGSIYYIFNNIKHEYTLDLKFTNKKNKLIRPYSSKDFDNPVTENKLD